MKLIKYSCRNFRNIESCSIEFDPNINVLVGKNGQGKTNLLESIYYVSTTRSFRISSDKDLIRFNELFSRIECLIEDNQITKKIGCVIHDKGKSCFLQNQQVPRTSEFIGTLNAILFVPSDLELFTASPKVRRKMMDIEIGKIDSSYNFILSKYNKLLKERNAALKMNQSSFDLFDVLDRQLAECQVEIGKKRTEFIKFINERMTLNYQKISEDNIKIECSLKTISENDFEVNEIYEKLKSYRQKDFILKNTSFGIHRDDIEFYMNDLLLDSVASQGQRRMTILSLKLTFIDYVLEKTKKEPILLLDDVLSELDIEKRKNLFSILPSSIQTFITTTDLENILEELPKKPAIYKMTEGHLEKGD